MNKPINQMPLVSVVMPSLNQAQFIEAAIRSVLEQDYSNIELIVADGLSTDGSIEILMRMQVEYGYDRLHWVSQKDNGAAEAINSAISLAKGEIIGWLNSDDMYVQGAVSRAVEHFDRYPNHEMVYGKGQHIDSIGRFLSNYPTKSPPKLIDIFCDGSFICQPTVFMRANALHEVGALDVKIRTAFDFDLFVRFFKHFPGRIGMISDLQAFSRLHPACMTQRLRRQVALDGMQVIKAQLNQKIPEHWFWTYVDEICQIYPFTEVSLSLIKQIEKFLIEVKNYYPPDILEGIVTRLKNDARIKLNSNNAYITIQPDGWVSKEATVKYRRENKQEKIIEIECEASWPIASKLELTIITPNGQSQFVEIDTPDSFTLNLEIPEGTQEGFFAWKILSQKGFIPAKHIQGSRDNRRLSFRVQSIKILP